MKYRLELYRLDVAANGYGEEAATYTYVRTVHAERVKASGFRSEEVGEHFSDFRAEWNVRDVHPVRENWRVKQVGGYEYTVTAVVPNLDRGMMTLVCERVNP